MYFIFKPRKKMCWFFSKRVLKTLWCMIFSSEKLRIVQATYLCYQALSNSLLTIVVQTFLWQLWSKRRNSKMQSNLFSITLIWLWTFCLLPLLLTRRPMEDILMQKDAHQAISIIRQNEAALSGSRKPEATKFWKQSYASQASIILCDEVGMLSLCQPATNNTAVSFFRKNGKRWHIFGHR